MNGKPLVGLSAFLIALGLAAAADHEPLQKADLSPEPKVKQTPLAFSPDGTLIAAAQPASGTAARPPYEIHLWDAANGKTLRTFKDKLTFDLAGLRFSANGKVLAAESAGPDKNNPRAGGEVKVFDVETGKLLSTVTGAGGFGVLALSPDGGTLAVEEKIARGPASPGMKPPDERQIKVYDITTAKPKVRATLPDAKEVYTACKDIRFFSDGKAFLTVTAKKKNVFSTWEIALWDTATGKTRGGLLEVKDTATETFQLDRMIFNPDDPLFACIASQTEKEKGSDAKTAYAVKVWDMVSYRDAAKATFKHEDQPTRVEFSADGKLAATVSRFRQGNQGFSYVKLWDVATGQEKPVPGHKDLKGIPILRFSPDNKHLAVGDNEGRLKIWDVTMGREVFSYESPFPVRIEGVTFAPDGKVLAGADKGKTLKLWDMTSFRELVTCTPGLDAVRQVRFAADGKAVTVFDGKTLFTWEVPAKK